MLSNRSLASLFSSSCSNLSCSQRSPASDSGEQKLICRMLKMKLLIRLVELGVLFSSFLLQAQHSFSHSIHPVSGRAASAFGELTWPLRGDWKAKEDPPREPPASMPPVAKLQPAESSEAFGTETRKEHDRFGRPRRLWTQFSRARIRQLGLCVCSLLT